MSCSIRKTVIALLVAQSVYQLHHAFGLSRIHASGRLVQEQQAGPAPQGARYLQQPLFTIRQVGGDDLLVAVQADKGE